MTDEELQAHAEKYPWDAPLLAAEIKNATFTEGRADSVECDIKHPIHDWIPITLTPDEYPLTYVRANKLAAAR